MRMVDDFDPKESGLSCDAVGFSLEQSSQVCRPERDGG